MNRAFRVVFLVPAVVLAACSSAFAHCQIPCGIYDDPARLAQLEEHITTIEKSMNQIEALSKEEAPNWNQIVRWVVNKETHADEFTQIVTFYFMAQRIKPVDRSDAGAFGKYLREVTLLHEMVFYAMKAKQTTDLEHCAKLRELVAKFKASYLGTEAHSHAPAEPHHEH